MLILIFFFLLFVQSNRRKMMHIREKNQLQLTYEKALMQSQLEIQEETLTHISEEIHDNIGQALSLVRLQLNTLGTSPDEGKINATDELLGKAISDLRSLSHSLNSRQLLETGLPATIGKMLSYLEKSGKYSTSFSDNSDLSELDGEKSIFLLRMIQEIINNIVKHAEATEVQISLDGNSRQFSVRISDNGKGFDTQKIDSSGKGIGIANIMKRARLVGATISFQSSEKTGTTVIIQVQ